jgi:perosamine synthetase
MQSLHEILVLPWNENYSEAHVDYISEAIHDAAKHLHN